MKKSMLIGAIIFGVIVVGGIIVGVSLGNSNNEEDIIQEEIGIELDNNENDLNGGVEEDYKIKAEEILTFSVNGDKYTLPVKVSDMRGITIESVEDNLEKLEPDEDTYIWISFNNSTHSNFMGNKNTYEAKIKNLTDSVKEIKECTIISFFAGTYESIEDIDEFKYAKNIIVGKSTVNDVIKAYGIKDYDDSGYIEIKNYDNYGKMELGFTSNGVLNKIETSVMVHLYE